LSDKNEKIRSMADLLRSGATLTDLSCPACSSPLFRLKSEELWCANCQKKVIVVKEDEQIEATRGIFSLSIVESTLLAKIQEVNERIRKENDVEELQRLGIVMSTLLQNLEKVKKMGRYGP